MFQIVYSEVKGYKQIATYNSQAALSNKNTNWVDLGAYV